MYRFKICELVTGKLLDEIPLTADGNLTRLLQAYGEGTLTLPLFDGRGELASETWEEALLPWRSLILIVDDQDRILWHGIPQQRARTADPAPRYPCRTIEAYLIERYVPDLEFIQADQTSEIFRTLAAVAGDSIGLEYDCPPSGVLRDRTYQDGENARVYDRINELAALLDGFNWTIDVVWGDEDHTFVRKIARTGYPHLGNRTGNPVHVFEYGQNITDFDYTESWASGDAATHVRALGDEDEETGIRLASAPVIDTLRESMGWPRLEARETYSGVLSAATLNRHADGLAARLFAGQEVLELTARNPGTGEDFTRLGDFTLGDTARAVIDCPSLTLDTVLPVVGWTITPATGVYKPALAQIGQ